MNATLKELQQDANEMVRAVALSGEEIILTDAGRPIAKIIPFLPTITVSAEEARSGGCLSDEAILSAIRESRDESSDRFEKL